MDVPSECLPAGDANEYEALRMPNSGRMIHITCHCTVLNTTVLDSQSSLTQSIPSTHTNPSPQLNSPHQSLPLSQLPPSSKISQSLLPASPSISCPSLPTNTALGLPSSSTFNAFLMWPTRRKCTGDVASHASRNAGDVGQLSRAQKAGLGSEGVGGEAMRACDVVCCQRRVRTVIRR